MQGARFSSLVGKTRSCMPQGSPKILWATTKAWCSQKKTPNPKSSTMPTILGSAAHKSPPHECWRHHPGQTRVLLLGSPTTTSPSGSGDKESACNSGDMGSIPGSGRSPGGGNGNPVQYSWLENPKDRRAWRATVHGVTKSQT